MDNIYERHAEGIIPHSDNLKGLSTGRSPQKVLIYR